MKKMKYLSLFSGCGGFDFGFHKLGFECVGAFDNWTPALTTISKNMDLPIVNHDLAMIDHPLFRPGNFDMVISGSPCQGFSTLGKRNLHDPRNNLIFSGAKVAIKSKAKIYIAENVTGLLSGSHKWYFHRLITMLEENNYRVETLVLNALDYGVAQIRKRVFILAYKSGNKLDMSPYRKTEKTLKDVLKNNTENNPEIIRINDHDLRIIREIQQGQKLCNVRNSSNAIPTWDLEKVFGRTSKRERKVLEAVRVLRRRNRKRSSGDADPVSEKDIKDYLGFEISKELSGLQDKDFLVKKEGDTFDLKNTFNGKYRRLCFDSPSLTVDTNFGSPRFFIHPTEDRGFSVKEAALIQSFPRNYKFFGTTSNKFRMIGNAVPPKLSEVIAKECLTCLC